MSNPRVTITLGRTGQVVERGGTESDFSPSYNGMVAGSKRSTREMKGIGSDGNGLVLSSNKRQRGDGIKYSPGGNTQQDYWLSRNDLRLKLMRKRLPKQKEGGRDLHAKISNPVRMPLSHHTPQYKSEANGSTIFRKIPARESADDLLLVDSLRNSYSSRTTNGLQGRSPDRSLRTSLGLSPPRNVEELWKVPTVRIADASRAGRFPSGGVVTASRPLGSIPVTMKAPPGTTKVVSQFASGGGSMQQSSHMMDEPRTVAGLLHALGLGKYAILFQAEEVDMTALRQMGDKDLKDLGLPMGPRKKILALVASRPK
ncbi:ankyrin repeat and SAM domain-containing protein 6 isoform X1 [Morus notabilis]|uniref:ankyrin repeat and SAM domain-containing protein 6 isoform X1 n=1 Tax=Morus notabilis TaxID=981085 RepID=UPI000CED5645|nr:ankyrin repeat and SAM domain-containing protein 6 isoform X1 [Morus notabilis]